MTPSALEQRLNYAFNDAELLNLALRHSSYVNELPDKTIGDNERLEFLGDAALSLCITDILMNQFPELPEGVLSRTRAHLVNESFLAHKARQIDLDIHIMLGRGEEQTQGRRKKSILAGAYEALLGAVYTDGGFEAVFMLVQRQFKNDISDTVIATTSEDYKSILQEILQGEYQTSPSYKIIEETGPDHDKTFQCEVTAADFKTIGTGKNKKSAQQAAARQALSLLRNNDA